MAKILKVPSSIVKTGQQNRHKIVAVFVVPPPLQNHCRQAFSSVELLLLGLQENR